jgi:hypothetical protein
VAIGTDEGKNRKGTPMDDEKQKRKKEETRTVIEIDLGK